MKKILILILLLASDFALADGAFVAPPCQAFGSTSGTCLQGAGALGTPSSGTITNLTGTASININGTVGATTPGTGAFTTIASTVANSTSSISLLSGAAGSFTAYSIGRTASEGNFGIAAGNDQFITGTIAGDAAIIASNGALFVGANSGTSKIKIAGSGGAITATGAIQMPSLASSSAAQTGTVCWTTGTGNLTVDTTTTCLLSASKFKHGIIPLENNSLTKVLALRPVSYEYNAELAIAGEQIGLIAEDVAAIDDRLVSHDPVDGSVRAVRYQQLTAVLAGAIKELKADNDNLRECQASWMCRIFGIR